MTSIHLTVRGAHAEASVSGPLTSGMVGIPVTISWDPSWEDLHKILVCKGGGSTISLVGIGTEATVAHEVLHPGSTLFLGIEGRNADGSVVIPTIWANCGVVQEGAESTEDKSLPATHPIWAQLQLQIGDLVKLKSTSKQDLVSAINAVLASVSEAGALSQADILALFNSWVRNVTWTETDPTVPAWAKAASKPSYTASEVGAEAAGSIQTALQSHNSSSTAHSDIRNQLNALKIPTAVSQLTNDAGYLTAHQNLDHLVNWDVFLGHDNDTTSHVTAAEKATWNSKSNFSGKYQDLTNKPTNLSAFTNDLYQTVPLVVEYEDGTSETLQMVVSL